MSIFNKGNGNNVELAISRRQKEEETTQNRNNDRRSMISNLYMNIQI